MSSKLIDYKTFYNNISWCDNNLTHEIIESNDINYADYEICSNDIFIKINHKGMIGFVPLLSLPENSHKNIQKLGIVTHNYKKTNSNEISLKVGKFVEIVSEFNVKQFCIKTSNNKNYNFPKHNVHVVNLKKFQISKPPISDIPDVPENNPFVSNIDNDTLISNIDNDTLISDIDNNPFISNTNNNSNVKDIDNNPFLNEKSNDSLNPFDDSDKFNDNFLSLNNSEDEKRLSNISTLSNLELEENPFTTKKYIPINLPKVLSDSNINLYYPKKHHTIKTLGQIITNNDTSIKILQDNNNEFKNNLDIPIKKQRRSSFFSKDQNQEIENESKTNSKDLLKLFPGFLNKRVSSNQKPPIEVFNNESKSLEQLKKHKLSEIPTNNFNSIDVYSVEPTKNIEFDQNITKTKLEPTFEIESKYIIPIEIRNELKSRKKHKKQTGNDKNVGPSDSIFIHKRRMSKDIPPDSLEQLYSSENPISIELNKQYKVYPWFHGIISRINCEKALTTFGKVGDYVIRIREKNNCVAISVRTYSQVKHYLIKREEEKFVFGRLKVDNLNDMIEIFKKKAIGDDSNGNPILLVRAFPKLYYKMIEVE